MREFLPRGLIPGPIKPEPPLLSRVASLVRELGWWLTALGALAIMVGIFRSGSR
jgi:hypothetical protein